MKGQKREQDPRGARPSRVFSLPGTLKNQVRANRALHLRKDPEMLTFQIRLNNRKLSKSVSSDWNSSSKNLSSRPHASPLPPRVPPPSSLPSFLLPLPPLSPSPLLLSGLPSLLSGLPLSPASHSCRIPFWSLSAGLDPARAAPDSAGEPLLYSLTLCCHRRGPQEPRGHLEPTTWKGPQATVTVAHAPVGPAPVQGSAPGGEASGGPRPGNARVPALGTILFYEC